jgi:DNA-binding transcriptional regulator YiaG
MSAKQRRDELRRFMSTRGLKATEVAEIVERNPQTVRAWMCGTRNVPGHALKLLKLASTSRR